MNITLFYTLRIFMIFILHFCKIAEIFFKTIFLPSFEFFFFALFLVDRTLTKPDSRKTVRSKTAVKQYETEAESEAYIMLTRVKIRRLG